MLRKKLRRTLPMIVMALSLFLFGSSKYQEAQAAEDKTFVIATDTTFAPFEFQDASGEYVGIDMDLMNAIAEDQGFKIEIRPLGFNAALQALEAKQVDGVIAGMSITDARKQTFDFSEPYFESGVVMAVAADSNIAGYKDLKGKNVAVKTGTEGYTFAESIKAKYGFTTTVFEDSANMYQDVIAGNSVAAFEDYPVMAYAIEGQGLALKLATEKEAGSSYGFAVAKNTNPELLAMFNAGLANLKANGKYQEIQEKYLGTATDTSLGVPAANGKTFVIATDTTFAPFEFQDANGNYVGIDMDLIREIAKNQGFGIEIRPLGFNAALHALEAKQVDAVIAGMSITDERKQTFDFSDPYFESGVVMAVAADSNIAGYKDLKGKNVAVKTGTEGYTFAESIKAKYGFTTTVFEDSANMYQDVIAGNSVAAFEDYPVMAYAIETQGLALKLATEKEAGSSYGIAVAKGENAELLSMINTGLANLQANGKYKEIEARYLGSATATSDTSFLGLIKENWKVLLDGLGRTIFITFISILIALALGIVIGLFSVSPNKALNWIATIYVDIMRGVPLIVLAFFVYFSIPQLMGIRLTSTIAGIITLSLNAAAYLAEIFRGGIKAVDVGQMEAGRSLGLPYQTTMNKVILPQAIRIMIPSFINQFVITLKDTSILSIIGLVELTQTGKIIIARTYASGNMWLIIGIMYIVVITVLTKVSKQLERRLKND
jgi:glutamine transport system permease protein